MPHAHARTDIACRNCGTPAPQDFCPACGQETALHPPTLAEFVHEFIGHYVALEGALWRTLGLLLVRPGRLTLEYLAGRRRRYVLPLRLYLTASFVFFLAIKLLPSAVDQAAVLDAAARPEATVESIKAAAASAAASRPGGLLGETTVVVMRIDCGVAGKPPCNALERFVNRIGQRFRNDSRSLVSYIGSRLMGAAPYAVFLLLPVFAGIVSLAWPSRRMTYGEHVVFSLHLHAFWFLAMLPIAFLPGAIGDVLLWLLPLYSVWAMHTVYGGGWGATVLRAVLVGIAYSAVLLIATAGLLVGLLAMA